MIVPLIALIVLLLVYAALGLRTIEEHEQGLVARFGRHLRVLEPGLHLIIPFVDRLQRIDLREVSVIKRIELRLLDGYGSGTRSGRLAPMIAKESAPVRRFGSPESRAR